MSDLLLKNECIEKLNTNRFIVTFGDGSLLHEWHVNNVKFLPIDLLDEHNINNKRFIVTFNQFEGYGDTKYLSLCKSFNSSDNRNINIEYLDKTGRAISKDHYHDCLISELHFTPNDYKVDKIKQVEAIVLYNVIADKNNVSK